MVHQTSEGVGVTLGIGVTIGVGKIFALSMGTIFVTRSPATSTTLGTRKSGIGPGLAVAARR
jgi:hypothetical protein